ncbi:hypothetical protein RP20_CCG021295 [Aedes albopictus]|nr:DNA polymerase alpha subunit B [Aedes albopictus]XP_019531576.2 DNA polymerase alpha subunit B [Aedes albopictus]XP_019531577.2 DNA polymerase alpha subunit B [Aedes albopictus]KXJ71173.1 hypothetical protein RP20_CCG021295 [Aedes albopictus]
MVSIESLREQFDEIGLEPSTDVIDKCLEICSRCGVDDPVEFVETWMAYSVSKLGGAEPTVDTLRDMESHEFANKVRKTKDLPSVLTTPSAVNRVRQNAAVGSPGSPRSGDAGLVIYSNTDLNAVDAEVLGSYGCVTPKAQKPVSKLHGSTPVRNKALFSPASYSPLSSKQSQEQDGPNNSGNVVYTFGNGQLLKQINWSSGDVIRSGRLSIEIPTLKGGDHEEESAAASDELGKFMNADCKYMFDSSYERSLILGDRIYEGCKGICRRLAQLKLEESQVKPLQKDEIEGDLTAVEPNDQDVTTVETFPIHHVDYHSSEVINVMGRIVVHPERKNDNLAIVDFDEMTLRYMKLDFSKLKTWSVFPGETVVLEGVNQRGNAFEVQKVHFEGTLQLPKAPTKLGSELNMVIASGPYTDKDDLLYEKLSDLLAYCKNNSPDVLILTGPFGDVTNSLFSTIAETYEEYFEKIITNIMSSVSPNTEVLIVSHHDDLMSMFVYPSFPYEINSKHQNLRFLPDPCVIAINGLQIGITTADVIKDLSEAEVSGDPKGDKIKRAFNYMFHHKTFYPLHPPPETLPLDLDLLNSFGGLSRVPNMMICPGDLKCYIRDVHGCVCINPGRLSDQSSGEGTFARVVVKQPESETTVPFNYVVCQVVKS